MNTNNISFRAGQVTSCVPPVIPLMTSLATLSPSPFPLQSDTSDEEAALKPVTQVMGNTTKGKLKLSQITEPLHPTHTNRNTETHKRTQTTSDHLSILWVLPQLQILLQGAWEENFALLTSRDRNGLPSPPSCHKVSIAAFCRTPDYSEQECGGGK